MGIFQRFEDEVPSIFVASFVAFLVVIVVFPISVFLLVKLFPFTNGIAFFLCFMTSFSIAAAVAAIVLAKLRKP